MHWLKNTFMVVLVIGLPAVAHDVDVAPSVVIDTDMGIDDAVTMAAALQCPQLRVIACVACEGVLDRETAAGALGRMLDEFNRGDVALYAGSPPAATTAAPPFRAFAERAVVSAVGARDARPAAPFAPAAYRDARGGKVVVLAIGPLTNLAEAVRDPAVRDGLDRVIVQGPPDPGVNWNIRFDPRAFEAVRQSGVSLEFITTGSSAAKPDEWREPDRPFGPRTTIGEGWVLRLLAADDVRRHYTNGEFRNLTDELVLLYTIDHELFERAPGDAGSPSCYRVRDGGGAVELLTRVLSQGRAVKDRVVFRPVPIPDEILMPDVRMRKPEIIAKNGESEWFAQLLMNELHEHLGSYSIIGVKMGLRAAELLNAPQHGMTVVSHSAATPPVSCLNDGIIVATGSTPGRALFRHEPGEPGSTRVSFTCNGRTLTLQVKEAYRGKVQAVIRDLLGRYSLEDARYWAGVRKMSLDIWQNWHRRDLFEIVETSAPAAPG